MRQVSVIILAYGDEPLLSQSVGAALDSIEVDAEVLLVDNGSQSISDVAAHPRLRILTPGTNTGFAGGCNLAAAHALHDTLVFANSDLLVRPNAIHLLTSRLDEPDVGLATGAVLLPGEPLRVNSIGNPIHYLMFSWAGAYGEPFDEHTAEEPVAGISGAFFACRREHWERLHGFDEEFFAYAEDADLSLRTWRAGRKVVFDPRAIGVHHYEFTKNNNKWFLLERNRLMTFLTLYDPRSVLLMLPIVLPVELGVLASAIRAGWAREKITSWQWLWTHREHLRNRRRDVASTTASSPTQWTSVLSAEMHIPAEFGLRVPTIVNWVLGRYWDLIRPLVR